MAQAQAQDKINFYLAKLDKELSKYPLAVEAEKVTKVPKAYLVGGTATVAFLLVFFNIWGNLIVNLVGVLWPAYQSFKAIESSDKEDDRQWLTYWTVYGFMTLLEFFTDILLYWIPFYYTFKAAFILYLIMPQTRGATVMYNQVLRPYLLKEQAGIDAGINKIKAKAQQVESEFKQS